MNSVVGLYGRFISNFLRKHQADFQSGWTTVLYTMYMCSPCPTSLLIVVMCVLTMAILIRVIMAKVSENYFFL